MNQATLIKIASKVVENRIRQQQALELLKQAGIKEDVLAFLAGIPGAVGTAAGKAKELASRGAGAIGGAAGTAFQTAKDLAGRGTATARDLALKVKALAASGTGMAAEWGSKGLSTLQGVGSKILANPYARYGGLGAGVLGAGALGAYGLSHLLGGGGGEAAPAAPAPTIPAAPDMAVGGGLLTPTYLDLLRANAPAVGAVAGGLGGAAIGAATSRKARIRNALIGLAAGAALGGGAGYLMNR